MINFDILAKYHIFFDRKQFFQYENTKGSIYQAYVVLNNFL